MSFPVVKISKIKRSKTELDLNILVNWKEVVRERIKINRTKK